MWLCDRVSVAAVAIAVNDFAVFAVLIVAPQSLFEADDERIATIWAVCAMNATVSVVVVVLVFSQSLPLAEDPRGDQVEPEASSHSLQHGGRDTMLYSQSLVHLISLSLTHSHCYCDCYCCVWLLLVR